jgi:AbiV family abortive infection protein
MTHRQGKADNKKLDRYVGRLSPKEIAQGMNCAISNAERLVVDAELLYQNGRYPSALAMAILAIEEEGKEAVLRSLAVARTSEDVRDAWKAYRTHTEKNVKFAFPGLTSRGASKLEDYLPLFKDTQYPQLVENLKQISIYTDCLGKANWSIPNSVISRDLAERIVSTARQIIRKKSEVTEKEIELWIKHVGPVWKKDLELMKAGLIIFYTAMINEGLFKGNLEEVQEFLGRMKEWVH